MNPLLYEQIVGTLKELKQDMKEIKAIVQELREVKQEVKASAAKKVNTKEQTK